MKHDTTTIEAVVHRTWHAATDIKAIELARVDGRPLPAVTAGAHIDVHLPDGIVRQYSLLEPGSAPTTYRIAVLREAQSRGGSHYMADDLHDGQTLSISPPRNHFALDESAASYHLLAGGIGVTPLVAMAHRLMALGKPFVFDYFVRDRDRAAFADALAERLPAKAFRLHVDTEKTRPDLAALIGGPGDDHRLYVCGPAGFLDAIRAHTRGWPAGHVGYEQFHAAIDAKAPPSEAQSCTVELDKSGLSFELGRDETLLEALERHGVDMPHACREGVCGTCAVGVLAGAVDHRDALQDDEERAANDVMYPCVSRPVGGHLLLDL